MIYVFKKNFRRGISLLLACLLLLTPLCGVAEMMGGNAFSLSLQWTDAQGNPMTVMANPIAYSGYENAYWAQVPPDAPLDGLMLQIADLSNAYPYFSVPSGSVLTGVMDAGFSLTDSTPIEIQSYTADNQPGPLLYLYISTLAPQPDVPVLLPTDAPVIVEPVDVTIRYVDESWNQIATPNSQRVEEGTWPVFAAPFDLPANYELNGDNFQNVTVDMNGANPAEVVFVYRYVAPPVEPVDVTIRYVDESWNQIATPNSQRVEEGTWPVFAAPFDLPENYELNGDNFQNVTVDMNGANPAEVVFVYRYVAPPVEPVDVTIRYVDESWNQIATPNSQRVEEGTWPVFAAPSDLPANYELNGDNFQNVTVDMNGANPAEVVFVYRYVAPPVQPVDVTIRYVDEMGYDIATPTTQHIEEGTWAIYPEPVDLPQYFELNGEGFQNVTVDMNGANPAQVIFSYRYNPPATEIPTPAPTEIPTEVPTEIPTQAPTEIPTEAPTQIPTEAPTEVPTEIPTQIPTEIPTEAPTQEPVLMPVRIPVLYLDVMSGMPVASETEAWCEVGKTTPVYPNPTDLLSHYVLVSEPYMDVIVDAYGQTNVGQIAFLYQYMEPETEIPVPTATPEPVIVRVQYLNEEGLPIAEEQQIPCEYGERIISPNPAQLPADYELISDANIPVLINEYGASVNPVAFIYRYSPSVPAPKIALVSVKYLNPYGESFYAYTETCVEGAENLISVDWGRVNAGSGYRLVSAESVKISVDANGVATPAEVIFQFGNELQAEITVYYKDAITGEDVAAPQVMPCFEGNNIVEAMPVNLREGYTLLGESTQQVILSADGALNPPQVIFFYQAPATPSPDPGTPTPLPATPTPPPVDTHLDSFCYPQGDSINFRSSPTTEEKSNIIGKVSRSDLAHIVGSIVNNKNELWYAVEINGQMGYLKETVVRVLTDAEIAALFNYTLAPTQVPTPSPAPIPDGAAIDRWAVTNKDSLNFRSAPKVSNATKIRMINKRNTRVWVYESETVDGEKWYRVCIDGTDGYLMADYVDLLSEYESQQIQNQLPSPMPVRTPAPTETLIPTLAPTLIPTDTPAPTASPTPVPYRGYAVTQWQTALRTGVSQTDESILEMLSADTLVYISGQTYVDGAAWSSAQAVKSGNLGFIPHEALRLITNEEARIYLDSMQPSQSMTATPVPEQVYGYAMTVGDGVPMRAFPDTNAEIMMLLPYAAVADVRGQSYAGGTTWHMVQYNGMWGFIREDQMRILSPQESMEYENSLYGGTPTPSPAPTPEPTTQNSLSSYGHVQSNSGKVNLRAQPSTESARLRLLDNYAFALVMGTITNDEGIWYHVSQAGTEGYVHGDYFKVLSLGELTNFLQSDEYQNANSGTTSSQPSNSTQLQPVEDFNQNVWQNPSISYEPFNPYLTPTPDPEKLPTHTPVPTSTAVPSPTPDFALVGPMGAITTPAPTTKTGGSAWPWVLLGLAAVGAGGAYYAYTLHRQNERRRQAVRAQQARQARAAAQQPQMRAAQNNPSQVSQATRAYQNQNAAPFMPPQSGAPRPTVPQQGVPSGTGRFQPVQQNGSGNTGRIPVQQSVSSGTGRFQPVQPPAAPAGKVAPTTNPYRPVSQRQIQEYQARTQNTPAAPVRPETQAYQPVPKQASETVAYKPVSAPNETTAYKPVQRDETTAYSPAAPIAATHQRQRRSERHRNQDGENNQ